MSAYPPGIACAANRLEVTPRLARINLMVVALLTAGLVLWLDPAGRPGDAGRFLGRLHPALVHLPIGLLVLAIGLDLAARLGRCTLEWARWIYVAGSWTGVAAVAAGLWLAQAGGYDADTLWWHRLSGVMITVGSAAVPWVQSVLWERRVPDAFVVGWTGVVAVALVVGGHLGGTLTHGPDYVTAHAPEFVRSALGLDQQPPRFRLGDPDTTTVYRSVVQPIFADRCVACHGAGRTRGGLDLTTPESIARGSEDGPVTAAGRPSESPLISRILLPDGHRRKMPPEDARPLSPSDARLLSWWVEEGASFDQVLGEATMPPDVRNILEAAGLGQVRTGVWALEVPPAAAAEVAALEALGARVRPVAREEPFLWVRCTTREACFGDGGAALTALANQVVWLDLSRSDVTDQDVGLLTPMQHLEKVWLQKTSIDGTGLIALESASYLTYLNVSETRVTRQALEPLRSVGDVYVWASPAGE